MNKVLYRQIDGILLLDKPVGMSSNHALQRVKKIFHAAKAGHTGSLDPLASGMLPICFGQATKFSEFLLNAGKKYCVTGKLGEKTTTADSEGEITVAQTLPPDLTLEKLAAVVAQFQGEISQVPPMYSAIKQNGQPLYQLARRGITVERKARTVNIEYIQIVDFRPPYFQLRLACSKGTYVRTLIDDIGDRLGCGAHVTELRREAAAHFCQNSVMHSLTDLNEIHANQPDYALRRLLLPLATAVQPFPAVTLPHFLLKLLSRGQAVYWPNCGTMSGYVRIQGNGNRFIGMGEIIDKQFLKSKRLLVKALF